MSSKCPSGETCVTCSGSAGSTSVSLTATLKFGSITDGSVLSSKPKPIGVF